MNILITGTSKGIGKALLESLVKERHNVISISRSKTQIEDSLLIGRHIEIVGSIVEERVYNELKKGIEDLGGLNGVVNNAGLLVNKDLTTISYEEVKASFDVNFYGPFRIAQETIDHLKNENEAFFINIGSIGGVQGSVKFPGLSVYSSTKGALTVLTECLAEEYKETGIHFNCLALGAVQTEMLEKAFPGYQAPYSPDQMASYIHSFIKDSSKMMNGKIISVSASTP